MGRTTQQSRCIKNAHMNATKQINQLKDKISKLEASIARDLASLPAQFGFPNARSFTRAVAEACHVQPGKTGATGKRFRAVIDESTHAMVRISVKEGLTGGQIAKRCGISLPSVNNVKKALGLVKPRTA